MGTQTLYVTNRSLLYNLYEAWILIDIEFRWFRKQSDEEREHAIKLMHFQNLRGGRVVMQAVNKPEKDEWGSALEAFQVCGFRC